MRQTTSVRLLLNLVDFVFHNPAGQAAGKTLLVCVLKCLVAKFASLVDHLRRAAWTEKTR